MEVKKGITYIKPMSKNPEYDIDDDGVVYSKRTGKPLSTSVDKNGYVRVKIRTDNKTKYVKLHRVLAETFYPEKFECGAYMDVIHKDGDKLNNDLNNLEVITRSERQIRFCQENESYSGGNHPNAKPIKGYNLKGELVYEFDCLADAAKELSKNKNTKQEYIQANLRRAKNGTLKTYSGFIWKE